MYDNICNNGRRNRIFLILCTCCIFAIGSIMIFSTTSAEVLDHDLSCSTHQAFFRQIIYAFLGIGFGLSVWKIGYRKFLGYSPSLLLFFTFLLALVLIPGIGKEVNGSRRWLSIAGVSFQPSEFVKYLVPAYFVRSFLQFKDRNIGFKQFIKLLAVVSIPMGLILIEPNNGTAAVIGMTLICLFMICRIRFRYWALPLCILLMVGGGFAYHLPYVTARIKVYLNPELDLKGKGHQPYQAKIAAGSGRFFGKGPGNSLQKLSYLPEAQNDYIAAIYAEEFGYAGILLLIVLYAGLACIGFRISSYSLDLAGFYFAGAITFLISLQAFLNLGVVSGLLPSTGLNLPFFSQGGSSLMANLLGIGLLTSIAERK